MTDFEREDLELKAIMGDKFIDGTEETPVQPTPAKQSAPVKNVPVKGKPLYGCQKPVKPIPNFMDALKQTTKDVCLWAALSLVVFWWQQTGKLEEQTAWYALLVCVGMVFFAIGKNWRRWCK